MAGTAVAAGQAQPPGGHAYDPALKPGPYDPDQARKLLADAGYGDGFQLTIHSPDSRYPNDKNIGEAVAQMLRRVGIQSELELVPNAVFSSRASKGEFAFVLGAWGTPSGDGGNFLVHGLHTYQPGKRLGAANWGRYNNRDLDELVERSTIELDAKKREDLVREAWGMVTKDVGNVWVLWGRQHMGGAQGPHRSILGSIPIPWAPPSIRNSRHGLAKAHWATPVSQTAPFGGLPFFPRISARRTRAVTIRTESRRFEVNRGEEEGAMAEHGTFMWNELVTPDPDACREFYGGFSAGRRRRCPCPKAAVPAPIRSGSRGETNAGGMFKMDETRIGETMPAHWMAYISVADVDATAAKVEKLGGQVKVPPRDIPDMGRFCVITDPTGAWVSLMTLAEGS